MASIIEEYIRQRAPKYGVDPNVAVRVALSEGGLKDPFRQGESMLSYGREQSYGPFQLHIRGGGVGERAIKAGIDPRKDWRGGVDYALKEAAQKGWGQWFGAAKAGIGNRTGLGGPVTTNPDERLGGDSLVARNFAPEVAAQTNAPLFGSMSPSGGGGGLMASGAPEAGAIWGLSEDKPKQPSFGDRLSAAGKALSGAVMPPAQISGGGADARQGVTPLLKLLENPNALAQLFMQRRMGA